MKVDIMLAAHNTALAAPLQEVCVSSKLARSIQLTAIGGLAFLVVALTSQKRELRTELQETRKRAERPYPGMALPELRLARLEGGDSVTLAPRNGIRQILFYFTTSCPVCLETLPEWKQIAAELADAASTQFSDPADQA